MAASGAADRTRILLVFVDGIGWGEADPARNPCLTYGGELFRLSAPPAARPVPAAWGGWARPLDAVLGVPGLPQSATGQTTLLTGRNAQAEIGAHLTGFPNAPLRELLLEHSMLKRAVEAGRTAAFLNAYRPLFFALPREKQLHLSATTVATLAAGLPFRTLDDVRAGRAVYQEFTNRDLRARGFDLPEHSPGDAGRLLARLTAGLDLSLFEYFQTDRAGHAQERGRVEAELRGLEAFLAGLLDGLRLRPGGAGPGDRPRRPAAAGASLVLLTSDHGNLEDLSTRGHTRHPVPLFAWGEGAEAFARSVTRLDEVAPAVLRLLA
jgi:hypothetical protein